MKWERQLWARLVAGRGGGSKEPRLMSLDYILRAIRKPRKDLKEGVSKSDLHFWKITLAAEWRIRPNTDTFSSWFTRDGFTCQDPTAQTFGTTLQLRFEPVHSVTYLALDHTTLEFLGVTSSTNSSFHLQTWRQRRLALLSDKPGILCLFF